MNDVLLPILKDTKDPHYRYKMPKLMAKIEGSGNGIRTNIVNMSAIAKALGRPPSYPTKYFGCELGAQVTINNDAFIVNGSHDADRLQSHLYNFISKFVLCTKCKNPETNLTVVNQTIKQKCIACGHETTIPKLHKLTTFIINHPPEGNGSSTNTSASSSSKGKSSKSDKKSKKNGQQSPTNNGDNGNSSNVNNAIDNNNNDDFDDDFDDDALTAAAYTERMRDLCDGLSSGMYISDSKESANMFYSLVKEKKEADLLLDTAVQKELFKEAERLNFKDKSTLILSELLFTENIIEEIKKYKMLLLRFCVKNKKAQKYLLGGYEKLVGDIYKDKLLNNAVKILKQFYDEEILDEDVIIEWSLKESKKYVSKEMSKKIHEKVAPLIKWLKEAEEEEDSEEDDNSEGKSNGNNTKQQQQQQQKRQESVESDNEDDDECDVDFSHRVNGFQVQAAKPVVVMPVNADSAETVQEDIDIDNI